MKGVFRDLARITLSPPAFYCTIALLTQVETFRLGGCFPDKKAKITLGFPFFMGVYPIATVFLPPFSLFGEWPSDKLSKKTGIGATANRMHCYAPQFFTFEGMP